MKSTKQCDRGGGLPVSLSHRARHPERQRRIPAIFVGYGCPEFLAKNSAELKQQYRSASIVSAGRVVFNIKGNDYRLVASVHYAGQVLFIKWHGTHREYDRIDVNEVEYDKSRYTDSGDPD